MEDITLFTSVDRTQDPGFYCRFLEQGNALADIQAAKPIILDGLRLSTGKIAADFGSLFCSWTASIFVILPPDTVTRAPCARVVPRHTTGGGPPANR